MNTKPYLVEEAINVIEKFLKGILNPSILEFGCGGSTIWFSNFTNDIISIDHDVKWYNDVISFLLNQNKKIDIRLCKRPYHVECDTFKDKRFDLILIDGRDRVLCANKSFSLLKSNGMFILDNSERDYYKPIYDLCKNLELREYTNPWWKTSIWRKK